MNNEKDNLYEMAKKLVVENQNVSASFLQRKLKIGYARAAHIIDILEQEKVVSPFSFGEKRKVLLKNPN